MYSRYGRGRGKSSTSPCDRRVVEREHFAQHERKRPPIEEGVVERPNDAVLVRAPVDDHQPHRRGAAEIDASGPVEAKGYVEIETGDRTTRRA